MVEEKKGLHRAYLVFIGVCLLNAGAMGLVLNVVGNYFAPIAMSLAGSNDPKVWSGLMPQVTLMMTVYSYVMFIWLPFAGRLFDKIDGRILFGAAGVLVALATASMGLWDNVFMFYISAACWGLCGPILFLVGPSVLINNWFAPHRAGKMLGIASAFTGVGAFVWSPVFGNLIKTIGYQTSFFIEGALAFVLIVPVAILFFQVHPEDRGLTPCGSDDPEEKKAVTQVSEKGGVPFKAALITAAIWLVFISAGIISLGGGLKSTMPAMALSTFAGTDPDLIAQFTVTGALMISTAAVGNVVGKIALGFLVDRIGIIKSLIIFIVLVVLGLLSLTVSGGTTALLLAGGFGVGCADALMSVGLPLVTRTIFGLKDYAKIYSVINMAIAILGGLGAVAVTTLVNLTGGYTMTYIIAMVAYASIGIFLTIAILSAKKLRANKWEEE